MTVEDFIDRDNTGKVKKRLNIKDADRVHECIDDIMDEKYLDKMFDVMKMSEDIVDFLDVTRISVDNLCRAYFVGFIMEDGSRLVPDSIKRSVRTVIGTYINKYYHTDCMDSVSALAQRKGDEGFDMDSIAEYAIKNLKVYNKEDIVLLMMFLGIFVNKAIRMGVMRDDKGKYNDLVSRVNLN